MGRDAGQHAQRPVAHQQARIPPSSSARTLLHNITRAGSPWIVAGLNSRTAGYVIRMTGGAGGGLSDGAPYPDVCRACPATER